jgi:hypothetical protein
MNKLKAIPAVGLHAVVGQSDLKRTPRTDAEAMRSSKTGSRMSPSIRADFARELERELNEANERIARQYRLLADASKKIRVLDDKLKLRAAALPN